MHSEAMCFKMGDNQNCFDFHFWHIHEFPVFLIKTVFLNLSEICILIDFERCGFCVVGLLLVFGSYIPRFCLCSPVFGCSCVCI